MPEENVNPELLADFLRKSSTECLDVCRKNAELMSLLQPVGPSTFVMLTVVCLHEAVIKAAGDDPELQPVIKAYREALAQY